MKRVYQPSKRKRANKHGFLNRNRKARHIILRRIKGKRKRISA